MAEIQGGSGGSKHNVGFQEDCKHCEVAKEWGGEACFYHNPKFKYQ